MEKKIVTNIIGNHTDGIVEQTTKKTLSKRKAANTPAQIIKNIC